jgi:hypothetical protein
VSFKVLVVPEDHTNNGAILKPLVGAILADAGKPSARVQVLDNPRVQGYDAAKQALRDTLVKSYDWMNLWLFMPDADRASPESMQALETELRGKGITLICCPAQPEVEIYAAAPYSDEIRGGWAAARRHPRFKEVVFKPLLAAHGDVRRPAGGRDLMIDAAIKNLPRLYQLCPELKEMRDRIVALFDEDL